MVVLGAVLLVLAVLTVLGILFTNGTPADLSVFGVSVSHVSVAGVFVTGVVTGAVGLLAITLLLGGGARKRHKRVEAKRERQSLAGSAGDLAEENTRLRSELADTRTTGTGTGSGSGSRGSGGPRDTGLSEGGLTGGDGRKH